MTTRSPRLLLVEDDRDLAGLLAGLLEEEGYAVEVAHDGQRGLHLGLTSPWDLLLLDRGLPVMDGLDLLGRLRRQGVSAPALVLSARGNPPDRVAGLDAGAEDYVGKPFDVEELLARLRALLRRHTDHASLLRLPGGHLDVEARSLVPDEGEPVGLSQREFALLHLLAGRPRQVFSREELLEQVFDGADDPGLVDTYVHYLRRKAGRGAVRTVRGVGYRLGGTP